MNCSGYIIIDKFLRDLDRHADSPNLECGLYGVMRYLVAVLCSLSALVDNSPLHYGLTIEYQLS